MSKDQLKNTDLILIQKVVDRTANASKNNLLRAHSELRIAQFALEELLDKLKLSNLEIFSEDQKTVLQKVITMYLGPRSDITFERTLIGDSENEELLKIQKILSEKFEAVENRKKSTTSNIR